MREIIAPALLDALENDPSDEVATAALVALGKIARELEDPAAASRAIARSLRRPNTEVAESAALALGLAGDSFALAALEELVLDTSAGRELVGGSAVAARVRAFAAYGLGLAGAQSESEAPRERVVQVLARASSLPATSADLPVACVISLGLVSLDGAGSARTGAEPRPGASLRRQVIELLCGRLERSGEASLLRAHAAVAAARLLDGDSALAPARERLVRAALAASRDADARVQRGALLALGQVCTGAESELDLAARSVLRLACEESAEPLTRRQALLGYARSCARPGPGDARTRAEARGFLLERLHEGPTEERAWAALACALFARTLAEAGAPPVEVGELHAALRARLGGEKAEECQAALSIAAALAGDVQSVPALRERLHGSSDERTALRIEALGVLGDRLAVADVRPFLVEWAARPELLRSAAEALGRLGDEDAAPTLLRLLAETPSGYAKAGIAWALGHFDDGRSVPALAALLGDRTQFGGARAFAAIALGRIGSGEDRPWNARFGLDLDPTAALPTLCDPLGGGGLLDIQ